MKLTNEQLKTLFKNGKVQLDGGSVGHLIKRVATMDMGFGMAALEGYLALTFEVYDDMNFPYPKTSYMQTKYHAARDTLTQAINGQLITMLVGANVWMEQSHEHNVMVVVNNSTLDSVAYYSQIYI